MKNSTDNKLQGLTKKGKNELSPNLAKIKKQVQSKKQVPIKTYTKEIHALYSLKKEYNTKSDKEIAWALKYSLKKQYNTKSDKQKHYSHF